MICYDEDVDTSFDVGNGKQWKRINKVYARYFFSYGVLTLEETFFEIPNPDSWFVAARRQQHHVIAIIGHNQFLRVAILDIPQNIVPLINSLYLVCIVMDLHTAIPASSHQKRVLLAVANIADLFRMLGIAIQNETCKNVDAEDLTANGAEK